ncbi:MAG TPA: response regulator [Polyangia bacterium]|jgi:CheY-like chemotaxis protein|nr:response regulator [Polyangia bacterium]
MGVSTVLLVEDDLDIRDILQDVLEREGYDVVPAGNGKQAIDFLTMNQPARADLVILDLMMPLVSGWEVLQRMRTDPSLAAIPVIVLSAVTSDKPNGAHKFISKPFTLDMIFSAVRECLGDGNGGGGTDPDRPGRRAASST